MCQRRGSGEIRLPRLMLVAVTLLVSAASANGQSSPPDSLTAAVLSDWPPYYILDASGSPAGFAVETFEAVARRAGFAPRYRVFDNFVEAVEALQAGAVDVIANMGIIEGRDLLFTAPVSAFDVSLFVRESTVGTATAHDVRGRVAVVEMNIGVELAADRPDLIPVVFSDVRSALFRLLAAEVDAIVYPAPVLQALARDADVLDRIVELEPALREVKRAMAVAPGQEGLRDRLDAALAQYLDTEEFRETYNRWHHPPPPFWTVQRVVVTSVVLLALLLLAAGVWRFVSLQRFAAALRARERTFRALAEGLSECVMLVSARDQSVQYVNGRCRDVLGHEPQSIVGQPIGGWVPAADPSSDTERQSLEMERADGTHFPAEVSVGLLLSGTDPPSYLVAITDVTERLRAEQQLRFQARLLDLIAEAVIATDVAGHVTYWNRYAEHLYGWTREEAMRRPVAELTSPASSAEEADEIMGVVRRGEVWSGEFTVTRRDGSTFPAHVTTAPILDEAGEVTGIVGVSADLTERKALEQNFLQAQKMEAIGRLAGGVAHDFNNLLTAVEGHASILLDDLPADSSFREDVGQIQKAGERAADLTRQLLAFSRQQVIEARNVDLSSVAVELEKLLRRLVPGRIRLRVAGSGEPAVVRADPGQIHQVVMNLVVNAVDAIEEDGSITIEVEPIELSESDTREIPWHVEPGPYVQLSVQDTGSGMPPEVLNQIFEPFFTTKQEGHGTGLGLATVYGIVKQSGGHLLVESEPSRGSTFRVLLPRVAAEADQVRERPAMVSPVVGGVVLLVEDDDAVRVIARRILVRAGYTVVEAANGREALDLAEDGIDVVISDVVMPDMGGVELQKRLTEQYPNLKVILTSGYSEAEVTGKIRQLDAAFLPKPFTPESLIRCVTEVLGGSSQGDLPAEDGIDRSSSNNGENRPS